MPAPGPALSADLLKLLQERMEALPESSQEARLWQTYINLQPPVRCAGTDVFRHRRAL